MFKKIGKIFVGLLLLSLVAFVVFLIIGFGGAIYYNCKPAEEVNEVFEIGEISNMNINIWVDEETGVNYVVYHNGYAGGITQRLNADGTVYVSGE